MNFSKVLRNGGNTSNIILSLAIDNLFCHKVFDLLSHCNSCRSSLMMSVAALSEEGLVIWHHMSRPLQGCEGRHPLTAAGGG